MELFERNFVLSQVELKEAVAALIAVPKVAADYQARKVAKLHVEQMPDVVVGTLKRLAS